ncbi:AAA family ATPase [Pseudomonas sp. Ps21-P2]|uniref:AAA family ATPase n=1 Tax=Pseudomonas sp. Ps21-P2 TaxID=3080331 RepID=UPI003208BC8C
MDEIRIKNLRTLSDTGYVKLKKINVLLGRNSSGKSTLARVFPLLKQGAKLKSKSGILWYGSDVDFGSYHNAKSRSSKDSDAISFTFVKNSLNIAPHSLYFQSKQKRIQQPNSRLRRVEVTAEIFEDEKKTAIYELKIGTCTARFSMRGMISAKFSISGVDLSIAAQKVVYLYRHSGLLPDIYPVDRANLKLVNQSVFTTLLKAFSLDARSIALEQLDELPINILYNRVLIARRLGISSADLTKNFVSFLRAYVMWRDFPLIWETMRD